MPRSALCTTGSSTQKAKVSPNGTEARTWYGCGSVKKRKEKTFTGHRLAPLRLAVASGVNPGYLALPACLGRNAPNASATTCHGASHETRDSDAHPTTRSRATTPLAAPPLFDASHHRVRRGKSLPRSPKLYATAKQSTDASRPIERESVSDVHSSILAPKWRRHMKNMKYVFGGLLAVQDRMSHFHVMLPLRWESQL